MDNADFCIIYGFLFNNKSILSIQFSPQHCGRGNLSRLFISASITIRDLDLLTIGMVNDMYAESRNDEYKGYREIATQEEMDAF